MDGIKIKKKKKENHIFSFTRSLFDILLLRNAVKIFDYTSTKIIY